MIVWKLLCCSVVCNISFDWLIFEFYWYLIDILSNENTVRKLIGFPDYIIVALKKNICGNPENILKRNGTCISVVMNIYRIF